MLLASHHTPDSLPSPEHTDGTVHHRARCYVFFLAQSLLSSHPRLQNIEAACGRSLPSVQGMRGSL